MKLLKAEEIFSRLFFFFNLFRVCVTDFNIYRYDIDDRVNVIQHDEFYPTLPPQLYRRPVSAPPPSFRRDPPTERPRYPVYIRPVPNPLEKEGTFRQDIPRPVFIPPTTTTTTTTTSTVRTTQIQTQPPRTTTLRTVVPLSSTLPWEHVDREAVRPSNNTPKPRSTTTKAKASNKVDSVYAVQLETPTAEVFLTRGNTEETTALGISHESVIRDISISPEMLRNGSEFNHVVLLCNASYPVEWKYEGMGAPMLYTTQIRTFGNFFDPSTYGHSSIVVLVQGRLNERQTGTYKCSGVDRPERDTIGFHLYFKGEYGFPSLQNVLIQPTRNDTTILIPCPTTDPGATIGLYRISSPGESRSLKLKGSFAYDPRKGFSVKLSDMSNPFGAYMCKFNDLESNFKIQVVRPKAEEVRVIPNDSVIRMDHLVNHSFMCKAREPIQLMLPNTVDFGVVEYSENHFDDFLFQAKLTITPNIPLFSVASYFKVNCQSKESRRILHTWEYSSFGTDIIKVTYDKHHKRLLCCSKSGLTPIHEMAKCETVTDCNIKKHCFSSGRCDYAFPPKFVDAPRGCTAIEFMDDFPSHVMRCSVGQFSEMMMVSSNIANDNLIIYDGSVPETPEILKIVQLKPQERDEIEVRCVASIFYFSTNIVFAFQRDDGTLTFVDESNVEEPNSYGPILKTMLPPGTKKVICFAPLTRSSEWKNSSIDVTGSEEISDQTSIPVKPFGAKIISSSRKQLLLPLSESDSRDLQIDPFMERILTSVKSSTSAATYLRKKQGHLIKVMQDF